MKVRSVVAAVVLAAFVAVGCALAASAVKIVVQCTSYKAIKPSMKLFSDKTAMNGKAIGVVLHRPHATTERGPSDDGSVTYYVKVPTTGNYQFWGHCWWWDGCGKSFFVMADATKVTAKTSYVTDQTFKKWHWVAGPVLKLGAGKHSIRIQYREDGTEMDQFLLTTTPRDRWEPTRVEKETSSYVIH